MEEKAIPIYREGIYLGNIMVDSDKQFNEEEFNDLVDKIFGYEIRKIERLKEFDEPLIPTRYNKKVNWFGKIKKWLQNSFDYNI